VPKDRKVLAEELHRELEIAPEEADLYLRTVTEGRCVPADPSTRRTAQSLSARGMLILDGSGDGSYVAVHPRLALSNLFRAYEDKLVRQRKEKRLLVDRLTLDVLLLLPAGESKGTNPTGSRGGEAKDE
jgi:hypothetical protein